MAKDPTSNPAAAARPGQRPPPIIDLAAEEVSRNARSDSAASSAAASGEASKTAHANATASASARSEAKRDEPRAAAKPNAARPEEPVIPSAFATASPPRPANAQAAPAGRSLASLISAAVAGGLLAAAAVMLVSRFLLPSPQSAPDLTADIAALEADIAALRQAEPAVPDAALDGRIAALEQSLEELRALPASANADSTALTDLESRLAALEQAPAPASDTDPAVLDRYRELEATLAHVRDEVAALQEQVTATQDNTTALQDRADSLQSSLDATNADVSTAVALGPAVMADALFDALQAGAPFTAELAAMRGLGLDETALDSLAPHAETGLPTPAALRSDFEAAAASIDVTPPLPAGTGTVDRLLQSARDLVEVRPADPVEGSDPPAILARIRGALDAGDLRTALSEWNALPADAKTATQAWAQSAQARLTAEEFVTKLRSDALSRLGGQG